MVNRTRITSRGFTLIETIAALVILAVAIPPMVWAIREAHAQRVQPAKVTIAQWLAAERLEDIIADRHSPTRGYGYVASSSYPGEATVTGFPGFSRTVTIVERGADLLSAGSGYKVVTVSVQWSAATGRTQTFDLSVVLTEYGS